MSQTALAFDSPIPSSAWTAHPVLEFLANYQQVYNFDFTAIRSERFYSKHCLMHLPDASQITGYKDMWDFFNLVYGGYGKVTRDLLSLILVPDGDIERTGKVYIQVHTRLFYDASDESKSILVPQSFVYTVGKADEGVGTDGLQFVELRCYYDMSLVKKAASLRDARHGQS